MMTRTPIPALVSLAALAAVATPTTAHAMTCEQILARLAAGDAASAVIAKMNADGAGSDALVQCLANGRAPTDVIAAARKLAAAPRAPVAAADAPSPVTPSADPSPVAAPVIASPPEPPRTHRPATSAPTVPTRAPSPSPSRAPAPAPAHGSASRAQDPSPYPYPYTPPAYTADEPFYGPLPPGDTETYTDYGVNPATDPSIDRWSTFAIDVDNGSYTMARRKLGEGYLPPAAAVRTEEFVNYLPYDYAKPLEGHPFGVDVEMANTPWRETQTVRIGVQGRRLSYDQRSPVHLTFLIDTSGSMSSADKLGLVKTSLDKLTDELEDGDTVAIVAYAGSAGLVLPPTAMSRKSTIHAAINNLQSGGSTAMGAGIGLAYKVAEQAYRDGAVNRVIIASDGDANVGASDPQSLVAMIEGYAKKGITLTTLGFGDGNYRDTTMEQLADKGDGNYFYIDGEREAERVLVDRLTSTLEVIAKDVKIQVEWSPDTVASYRLLGYENRDVADRDFRNDAVDGGEIGAGHQVTALYEVTLTGEPGDLGKIHIRSKAPGPDAPAVERAYRLAPTRPGPDSIGSRQLRMALASAGFAEVLRASQYAEDLSLAEVHRLAVGAQRAEYPEDAELVGLIAKAMTLRGESIAVTRSR